MHLIRVPVELVLWSPVALVWHLIGVVCLTNISLLFLLSVPGPGQLLHGDDSNEVLLFFGKHPEQERS
jgi:hypothetical protein